MGTLGPRREMFSDPRQAARPSSAPPALGTQGPPPKAQQARNPPDPTGLTFPGDADAIQPGLLEAQMESQHQRSLDLALPRREPRTACPGPGQALSGLDSN